MHEQHPVFTPPTNPDIPIWRYIDLARFISMLEHQALHFSRADRMWDTFEGSLSEPSLDFERNVMLDGMPDENWAHWRDQMSRAHKAIREHTYLSCWHMNEHESVAMWNAYQSSDRIAIRSTYRRLAECLDAAERERIYIGTVTYIDYKTDEIPWNNGLYPYVHKRKSFEFERELRALFETEWTTGGEEGGPPPQLLPPGPHAIPVVIDLDQLAETVYVSPRAQGWYRELIQNIVTRYGRNWPVVQSHLDSDPVF
jgi:hypothetical protein